MNNKFQNQLKSYNELCLLQQNNFINLCTTNIGKQCTKCNEVKPHDQFHKDNRTVEGYVSQCKLCWKKYRKEYYENNKEKTRNENKEYRENNKEKIHIKDKEYRENNKEKIHIKHKIYYQNNKDQILEYNKEYRQNNKDQILEYNKEYRQNNKEKIQIKNENYKSRKNELYRERHTNDIKYRISENLETSS